MHIVNNVQNWAIFEQYKILNVNIDKEAHIFHFPFEMSNYRQRSEQELDLYFDLLSLKPKK